MGWYTYDALSLRDYPLLMGVLMLFSTVTVLGVLIADFTYGFIDPRASQGEQEAY
jgi:peptide/nickel transport system permease protein